jgi:8-oxo-dGTP diphosphatase
MSEGASLKKAEGSPAQGAPLDGTLGDALDDQRPFTEVAVGLVHRPQPGRPGHFEVLMGQRPDGKPYAGWWEFPGGKIETGESVALALARELEEELALRVAKSLPWVVRTHSYPHARVRLHFRRIFDWSGEPVAMEEQAFAWQALDRIALQPLLPAALPLLDMLRWPSRVVLLGFRSAPVLFNNVLAVLEDPALTPGDRLLIRLESLRSAMDEEHESVKRSAVLAQLRAMLNRASELDLRIYLNEAWQRLLPEAAGLWRACTRDDLECLEVSASEAFFETDHQAEKLEPRALILLEAPTPVQRCECMAANVELPLYWPSKDLLVLGGHGYTVWL